MQQQEFGNILKEHAAAHPSMGPQDAIKLCYQATYGAEHLLTDAARAQDYLEQEWAHTAPADRAITEVLSERYARVDLAAWKLAGLPLAWLFRMFYLTASTASGGEKADLTARLDAVGHMATEGQLPFSAQAWCEARTAYEQSGGGAIHHSEAYRLHELPSYRVVDRCYTRWIPLLKRLAMLPMPSDGRAAVIAIDGRAASGKSTLARQLGDILAAGLIHMDDFFLPPELRTAQRLAQAGGNVHTERFIEQVLPQLRNNDAFTYPIFNCEIMQLDGVRDVTAGHWRIVEGSYSHHPALGQYMDIRVFCYVDPQEQMRRILNRNGARMAEMFATRWIPMEEHYFKSYSIRESAETEISF